MTTSEVKRITASLDAGRTGTYRAPQIQAYDYEAQRWTYGDRARRLLAQQCAEEAELLAGPQGEAYARYIGADRAEALRGVRALAETLTDACQVARDAARASAPTTAADDACAARDRASAEAEWRNDSGDGAEIFDE